MNCIVTTATKPDRQSQALACSMARGLALPLVQRQGRSLTRLQEEFQVSLVLVCTKRGPVLHTETGEFFFHPSMAKLRLQSLKDGNGDYMVEAMNLGPGMRVLDCTLGLGADAVVASYVVGKDGWVVALEKSPLIAAITSWGLQNYSRGEGDLLVAMRRVKVFQMDYKRYLEESTDNSFDIVYFDPMFRKPVKKSAGLNPLRTVASYELLATKALREAERVARYRVVVKERRGSGELERLGFKNVCGGKSARIVYGYKTVGEEGQ